MHRYFFVFLHFLDDCCQNLNAIEFFSEQYYYLLCNKCEKSKRPNLSTIKELISAAKELNISSIEEIAINLLLKRIILWNKKVEDILKLLEFEKSCLVKLDKPKNVSIYINIF